MSTSCTGTFTITPENKDELMRQKAQRRQGYRERIPIEGKFGQGKYGYRINNIRTGALIHLSHGLIVTSWS
ncbi:hypothetical protein [Nitrosomonas ureae]|uniref:Transposase DDE domain-containing protein n=1 Tax=Nitrosomonas ureae TaxID=44577 RepID=A0A1H5RRS4_9PROT|nr:hypothetical protein [Nitrosomonas ureae]SEF41013.1 hypothetical protein SAMN05216334_101196 [Nitrosomonas ureae]